MFAPRFLACSYSSKIKAPPPSPITNPSRLTSKGREASDGFSFCVDKAFNAENPPIPDSLMAASEPPATIISAFPHLMWLKASIMAVVDVAQAETGQKFTPCNPWRIEIIPAAMSTKVFGIKYGLNLGVPSPAP